ncbi:MAG: ATP synthase F0 subunit B [Candidatus Tectomicrobia bacterium]|uniref:ATP synthase subunit b n=1 Tax=Tectimicrobiota bacterium TaxID=2528274 RepID=A0A932I1R4_UNCTE|nr:ATP synthase F0 subunit B [Candidatus Tectomicrobia bacterium]
MGGRARAAMFLLAGLALAALPLLAPGLAFAAEAGEAHHKSFNLTEELFKLLNTLIVVGILYKLAARPLRNFLAERREGIRKALAEAERARQEAERQLEVQRTRVAGLEAELGQVRETGRKERDLLRERLQADQEAQAKRLLEQAKSTIALEATKARADLQNQAALLALGLAEDMLAKNLGPEDQKRFVEDYVAKLDKRNGGAR